MKIIRSRIAAAIILCVFQCQLQAEAQVQYRSQGAQGDIGRKSKSTNNYRLSNANKTQTQRLIGVKPAGFGGLAGRVGVGLPPTSTDSFVLNAGGEAEQIYGGDGTERPVFNGFTQGHRINDGIHGQRAAGLTTGHSSVMPNAWGGDEWCHGTEWSQSAASGNTTVISDDPQFKFDTDPYYQNGVVPPPGSQATPTTPPYPQDGRVYRAVMDPNGNLVGWQLVSTP